MNEEIKYIPYGLDEISQLDLMTSLANGIEPYLNSKRWARKEKNRKAWLSAYLDIINLGLVGASNESGVWRVNHSGNIDMDSKSDLEKEMYGDAAYYIRQQMSKMTPRAKEEDKKEEKKDKYNFINDFLNHLLTKYYGNNKELYLSPTEGWDSQDERDPKTGLRTSITNRKTALINALTSYKELLEDKYDFEGSSFSGKDDVVRKIDEAIEALNSPDLKDDNEKLHALGLGYNQFFSNGGNDVYGTGTDGNPVTYADYYKLKLLADLEAASKLKAKATALRASQYGRLSFLGGKSFKGKRASDEHRKDLAGYLNNLTGKSNYTPDEISEIVGAFKFAESKGALLNLSKEELLKFGRFSNYANNPGRLKKINEVQGLYWDSIGQRIVKPHLDGDTNVSTTSLQDLVDLNNPETILQKYLNSTEGGFTPAELREVAALLFDLGAAVDPEGFSSAGLSQIAAVIRDYNRASDPEGWTLGDTGWATLDHGLGLLSLIPIAGGLIKGAWAAEKLGKYIPKMESAIRYLGRAGSTYAMAANAPGALNTLNKIKNGEDLSLKDYLDLAYFFIGGLGHHLLNKTNRSERLAMKARGIETSNSILNKAGITRTKAKTNNKEKTTPTLKVLKTGEDGKVETKEISIDAEKQKVLAKTKAEDLEAKAKELEIEIPEGYKILPKSTTTKTWSRENMNRYLGRGNKEIFGTPIKQQNQTSLKSNEEFEQYLLDHNNSWLKKVFNGTNRDIRRYDKRLNIGSSLKASEKKSETSEKEPKKPYKPLVENSPLKPQPKGESSELFNIQRPIKEPKSTPNYGKKDLEAALKSLEEVNRFKLRYSSNGKGEAFDKSDGFNSNTIKEGKLDFDGITIKVSKSDLKGVDRKNANFSGKVSSIRNRIAKLVELYSKTHDVELTALVILKLKKKGWLKQGGQINLSSDDIIENFIKNYNI